MSRTLRNALLRALIVPLYTWAATAGATILPASVNTSASPSPVSMSGTTYVFYKGAGDDPGIYMTHFDILTSPASWTDAVRLPDEVGTSAAPSAFMWGTSTVCIAYKGAGSDTFIYVVCSLDSGANWSMTRFPNAVNTSTGPGARVDADGNLHVFYKGAGSDPRIYDAILAEFPGWTLLSSGIP